MDIQLFNSAGFGELRAINRDGEPWFVAKDVCDALGLGNSRQALSRLDEDEKGVISNDTLGGVQEMASVNEPGLYTLVLSSRKPEARAFKRWVTHEVIPAIRRTGGYMEAKANETPEETMARAVLIAQDAIARKDADISRLRAKTAALAPKAGMYDACMAGERWTSVTEAARIMAQYDPAVRRKDLYEWLRRDRIATADNQATRYAIERAYAVNYQPPARFDQATGELVRTKPYIKLTSKGLDWCIRRYCDRREAAL
ncbi:phage antirepressor KilAC domain-containing protein [Slackia exigua]|uniref:BRO family protein n=1 Tax=Slackia exigua TaxID=84109 RepID=UPI003BA2D198